jgi:hypothetical protein
LRFEASGEKILETPIQQKTLGVVAVIPATAGRINRRVVVQPGPEEKARSSFKNNPSRAGGMVQVVENLPGKHVALSSNPSPTKQKQKQKQKQKTSSKQGWRCDSSSSMPSNEFKPCCCKQQQQNSNELSSPIITYA